MPYCVNCGEEISEHQFNNFDKSCPACVRLNKQREPSYKRKKLYKQWWCIIIYVAIIIALIVRIIFEVMTY